MDFLFSTTLGKILTCVGVGLEDQLLPTDPIRWQRGKGIESFYVIQINKKIFNLGKTHGNKWNYNLQSRH